MLESHMNSSHAVVEEGPFISDALDKRLSYQHQLVWSGVALSSLLVLLALAVVRSQMWKLKNQRVPASWYLDNPDVFCGELGLSGMDFAPKREPIQRRPRANQRKPFTSSGSGHRNCDLMLTLKDLVNKLTSLSKSAGIVKERNPFSQLKEASWHHRTVRFKGVRDETMVLVEDSSEEESSSSGDTLSGCTDSDDCGSETDWHKPTAINGAHSSSSSQGNLKQDAEVTRTQCAAHTTNPHDSTDTSSEEIEVPKLRPLIGFKQYVKLLRETLAKRHTQIIESRYGNRLVLNCGDLMMENHGRTVETRSLESLDLRKGDQRKKKREPSLTDSTHTSDCLTSKPQQTYCEQPSSHENVPTHSISKQVSLTTC